MRLMILENQRLRNSLRMDGGSVSIGSDAHCQIHLPDPRLGKHQANITRDDDGEWWLEVIDHAVPTCVNRAVQKSRTKLHHADEIECGPFSIRCFIETQRSREDIHHDRAVALLKAHADSLPLDTIILKEDEAVSLMPAELARLHKLVVHLTECDGPLELLPLALDACFRQLHARRAWIGARKTEKDEFDWSLAKTASGQTIDRPHFSEITQPRCMRHGHHLCLPAVPHDAAGSAMAVPIIGSAMRLGMIYVENDPGDNAYDASSLALLRAIASATAAPLDAMLRNAIEIRRAARITELTIARATQDALTPRALPRWDAMPVAAYRHMGTEICCDYYDVMQLRDKSAALVVAKAAFPLHAIPRVLSEIRAAFRSAVLYGEAPHLFVRALNWLLYDADADTHLDIAVARVWPETGKVQLCLAGGDMLAARITADGVPSRLDMSAGPPVAQSRGIAYESASFDLTSDEALVFATGGFDHALDAAGRKLGWDGLLDALGDDLGNAPGHMLNELAAELTEFTSGGAHPHDMTILMLRREG